MVDQLVARPDALKEAQLLAAALDDAEAHERRLTSSASEIERRSVAERVAMIAQRADTLYL